MADDEVCPGYAVGRFDDRGWVADDEVCPGYAVGRFDDRGRVVCSACGRLWEHPAHRGDYRRATEWRHG